MLFWKPSIHRHFLVNGQNHYIRVMFFLTLYFFDAYLFGTDKRRLHEIQHDTERYNADGN